VLFSEKIIEKLVNIGWDHIKISLHGATEKTHDNLVKRPGSFKKIIHAVELFNEYKKKFSKNTPYIEFGFVLVKKNYKQVAEIIKLASKINTQAVFIEPITVYTKTGRKLKLNKWEVGEFRKYASEALGLAKKYGIDNNLSNFVNSDLIKKTGSMQSEIKIGATSDKKKFLLAACFEPWYRMGIRNDGVVCPCGFFDVDTKENVNEKSLKEIWFGDYFKKFRLKMLENNLPDYCSKCCTTLVDNNRIIRNELEKVL
jgi:MoaA/NifB/PqqE/SkfB family radical SAM enzyme